jgi:hypothetical protein
MMAETTTSEAADDATTQPSAEATTKKIPRPFTAYTIYFRLEHHRILQSAGPVDESLLSNIVPNHFDPVEHPRPSKYENVLLPPYWYQSLSKANLEKKRKHRKGKSRIDLRTLSKMISTSWREANDQEVIAYCQKLADFDAEIYEKKLAETFAKEGIVVAAWGLKKKKKNSSSLASSSSSDSSGGARSLSNSDIKVLTKGDDVNSCSHSPLPIDASEEIKINDDDFDVDAYLSLGWSSPSNQSLLPPPSLVDNYSKQDALPSNNFMLPSSQFTSNNIMMNHNPIPMSNFQVLGAMPTSMNQLPPLPQIPQLFGGGLAADFYRRASAPPQLGYSIVGNLRNNSNNTMGETTTTATRGGAKQEASVRRASCFSFTNVPTWSQEDALTLLKVLKEDE